MSALEDDEKIIDTTLQKFGVIALELHDLPGSGSRLTTAGGVLYQSNLRPATVELR